MTLHESLCKNILGHTGIHGCDRCRIVSEFSLSRRKFPYLARYSIPGVDNTPDNLTTLADFIPRTDFATRNGTEKNYEGPTPFSLIPGLDLVKDFLTDSMHNVYTGVTKKHIEILIKGVPDRVFKLSAATLTSIGLQMTEISKDLPIFFSQGNLE